MTAAQPETVQPEFGALAPNRTQMRAREITHRLPYNYFGRKLASLLLGAAGGRTGQAYDVTVFGSQKVRLHPADNICEKRVFVTPQHWDPKERARLAEEIAAHTEDVFYFVDIGANAGLYALFARSITVQSGKALNAICIEPDPEMRRRLYFNCSASRAETEISVFPCAAAGADGPLHFSINQKSRGMSCIDEAGALTVEGRALNGILDEARLPRIDAMKIDIEGHEFPVLDAFFKIAPKARWPRLVILETSHEDPKNSARIVLTSRNYDVVLATRLNAVLRRPF